MSNAHEHSEGMRMLRVLHIAALPFPTYQGTQGAIRSMLDASSTAGLDAQLFTYATRGYEQQELFPVHRTGSFPSVNSLHSGPSLAKLLLDARMGLELRALQRKLRPEVVIAHHVEAATLALAARQSPVVFFAHTDLQVELPVYGPALLRPVLERAGAAMDRALVRRADAVAVISKTLLHRFRALAGARAHKVLYVPTPWQLSEAVTTAERSASRQTLGLSAEACVALYAGNLDAYQGIDVLLSAAAIAAQQDSRLVLLVATESDQRTLLRAAARQGLSARLRVTHLQGDAARRCAHAAADFAVVPRLAPGGLPIKLLEALSRGVACATMPHACAGLALHDCVELARDESPQALAAAISTLAREPERRRQLATRGRRYIAAEHASEQFTAALGRAISAATT